MRHRKVDRTADGYGTRRPISRQTGRKNSFMQIVNEVEELLSRLIAKLGFTHLTLSSRIEMARIGQIWLDFFDIRAYNQGCFTGGENKELR